jgi:hypothetical protein
MGIGFVPFMATVKEMGVETEVSIIHPTTGLANTSILANWPLHVQNLPFGDSLSLMINHAKLQAAGIGWYRVYLTDDSGGIYPVETPFSDLRNGHQTWTGTTAGKYPIRTAPTEWYFPHLGTIIHTQDVLSSRSGLFDLHVRFYDGSDPAKEISPAFRHKLLIDNRRPRARMDNPTVFISSPMGTKSIGDCRSLPYIDKINDILSVKYELEEPDINYSVTTWCGVTSLPTLTQRGKTMGVKTVGEIKHPVRDFLNGCQAALISVQASLSIPVTNGYQAYSHGSTDAVAFALYKEEPPGP